MIGKTVYKQILRRLRHTVCAFCLPLSVAALPALGQNQVHQLSFNGSTWTDQNLNGNPSSPLSLAAFLTTPNNQRHVYYSDLYAPWDVRQLFFNGTSWSDEDLTAESGGAESDSGDMTGFSVGNYQYIYYIDNVSPHLHQLVYNNAGWVDTDLTALTHGPEPALGGLVAYTTTPAIHLYYSDVHTQHIHQIFNTNGTNWQDQDLTGITGGAVINNNSPYPLIGGFNIGNYSFVYFVDGGNHVHEYFYNNITWADKDLTALTKAAPAALASRLEAFLIPGTKKMRVFFTTTSGHIVQLASTNNTTWTSTDLTKKSKAPLALQDGGIAAYATSPNNELHVNYISGDHVNQIFQPTSTTWVNEDLTSLSNGGLVYQVYSGSDLAGFSLPNRQYVFYVAQ